MIWQKMRWAVFLSSLMASKLICYAASLVDATESEQVGDNGLIAAMLEETYNNPILPGHSRRLAERPALARPDSHYREGLRTYHVVTPQGNRTYFLYIPYNMTEIPALVLDIHSFWGDPWGQMSLTKMKDIAEENKTFVVAYPMGIGNHGSNAFNAGSCCGFFGEAAGIDDLTYFKLMIDEIKENLRLNPRRIYAYGLSMGAAMGMYFTINYPEYITAITTNMYALNHILYDEADAVKQTNPNFHAIPVLSINGYSDKTYACWTWFCPTLPTDWRHIWNNAHEGWHRWAKLNSCTGEPVTLASKPFNWYSPFNGEHTDYFWIKEYQNCAEDVVVRQILNSNSHGGETGFVGESAVFEQENIMPQVLEFLFQWTLPARVNVTEPAWWT